MSVREHPEGGIVAQGIVDKVVLITGGGTGMGAATASLLAELGAHPVVLGIDREPIEAIVENTGGLGHVGDAADPETVAQAVTLAVEKWGRIDALVNCAGGGGVDGSVTDLDDDGWEFALRQNLRTAIVASRACMPAMVDRGGSVVVVSSLAGIGGYPGMVSYMTAKHALIGLVRSMAVDFGPKGVRVNALCPGLVRTPMGDRGARFLAELTHTNVEDAYQQATRLTPLGRPGEPGEIAGPIVFLLSEWASYLTGVILPIDGGASCAESSMFSLLGYGSGSTLRMPDMSGRKEQP